MTQLIGTIPMLYNYNDGIYLKVFTEKLEQYFEINNIPDDIKRGILLTSICDETYMRLRKACHPTLPKDKTYAELCELFRRLFDEKKSVFCERHKFYNARQKRNEDIKSWFLRIEELANDCKFGDDYDSIILDRFISGLRSAPILDKLSEIEDKLTIERVVDIAVNKENTLKYFKEKNSKKKVNNY